MTTREKIYHILEPRDDRNILCKLYDIFMLAVILLSLSPLVTHSTARIFTIIDIVTCCIFIADYLLRWATADYSSGRKGLKAFLLYPFTPMAIVDLLSILPTLSMLSPTFKILRVSRLFKVIRVFKFIRYYEPIQLIWAVIRREAKTLTTVVVFAVFYIFLCALVMFNVESDPLFATFYDAIYWACCTLTTVGYGDIHPVSDIGRAFSMLSAIVGIALIALPSGIITSGYIEELRARKERENSDFDDTRDEV